MYKEDLQKWLKKEIDTCTGEYVRATKNSDDEGINREADKMIILLSVRKEVDKLIECIPCTAL